MRIKNILLICASALLMASSLHAHCGHRGSSHKKTDRNEASIVGTYTLQITQGGGAITYGNISFHEGGTLHGMESLSLGQLIPGGFPEGSLSTVWTGNWEKIGKFCYWGFFTAIIAVKDGADCCPSFPFVRYKVEGPITFTCDYQQFSWDAEVSFWDLNDLTLNTTPVGAPFHIPEVFGQRVPVKR